MHHMGTRGAAPRLRTCRRMGGIVGLGGEELSLCLREIARCFGEERIHFRHLSTGRAPIGERTSPDISAGHHRALEGFWERLDNSGYRKENQKREVDVTSRFCLVALSGFEPEFQP